MTVLIQNLTNEIKHVARFDGSKLHILPNNFVKFECTNPQEVKFWGVQSTRNLSNIGINVVIDDSKIRSLVKLQAAGKLNFVKVTNNDIKTAVKTVENIVETKIDKVENVEKFVETKETYVEPQITIEPTVVEEDTDVAVESTVEEISEPTIEDSNIEEDIALPQITDENVNDVKLCVPYTEESLSVLSKEELQEILNDMGIAYKKNNSVSTLISLIISNK